VEEAERDRLLVETRTDVAVIKERMLILADHEVRLRSVERFRYSFPGVAVIAVLLAGASLGINLLY
jgi:hypothetical protein